MYHDHTVLHHTLSTSPSNINNKEEYEIEDILKRGKGVRFLTK